MASSQRWMWLCCDHFPPFLILCSVLCHVNLQSQDSWFSQVSGGLPCMHAFARIWGYVATEVDGGICFGIFGQLCCMAKQSDLLLVWAYSGPSLVWPFSYRFPCSGWNCTILGPGSDTSCLYRKITISSSQPFSEARSCNHITGQVVCSKSRWDV